MGQPTIGIGEARTVTEQCTALRKYRPTRHHRRALAHGKVDDALTILNGEAIRKQRYGLRRMCCHLAESLRELFLAASGKIIGGDSKPATCVLGIRALDVLPWMFGIGDDCDPGHS